VRTQPLSGKYVFFLCDLSIILDNFPLTTGVLRCLICIKTVLAGALLVELKTIPVIIPSRLVEGDNAPSFPSPPLDAFIFVTSLHVPPIHTCYASPVKNILATPLAACYVVSFPKFHYNTCCQQVAGKRV